MPNKRESSEPVKADRVARRQRLQEERGAAEALLLNKLMRALYPTRPNKFQRSIVDYVFQMRTAPAPRVEEYVAFIRAAHSSVKSSTVAEGWETLKTFFSDDNQERHIEITGLANISGWVAAFKVAPTLDAQTVETISIPPPPPAMVPDHPTSSSSSSSSRYVRVQDRSFNHNRDSASNNNTSNTKTKTNSSNSSSSSSSDSNGSSKSLSSIQVLLMHELFKTNFDKFQGDEWLLPSGSNFDHVLYESVKGARYECPLHSFVIENPDTVLDLFPDPQDKDELRKVMIDRAEERLPVLSTSETALLSIYNKSPDELEELFAEKGWRAVGASLAEKPPEDFQRLVFECVQQLLKVYRGERMALPQAPHEPWVVNRLWSFIADALRSQYVEYQPGEYHSQASMHRRNLGRPRGVPQFVGHKVDGVAVAASRKIELLVLEAAKKDEGPNVTKALDDGLKLCKLIKDMHDFIRDKAMQNVRERFVTFGIQISGERATFLTLRQRRGRFYQLCHEGCETLPALWVDQVDTQCVLRVLAKVIIIRKALLSTARDITEFTTGSLDGTDPTNDNADRVAATLTSPQLIPSSPSQLYHLNEHL
ncbi:hypothetical protein B0O80DRAFT_492307 [Mortierella sp. GBAus27b]|nr:hypothetical protein BGX31_002850 [Mortierella sp. GBA43]KAI8363149.1 hypothetical protein B0O80DRAFT_492307 [Mortierella sp. GBAus27b]